MVVGLEQVEDDALDKIYRLISFGFRSGESDFGGFSHVS